MKQLFSILLLGLFAFNIFGYKIYFDIAEKEATAYAESKIENQEFNSNDLVTYKYSIKQLPYYTNNKNYEIAYGEVVLNKVVMTYVKKRIYNDSVEYVCLPNIVKTNLRTAREDFFKLVNDFQNLNQKQAPKKQPNNTKPFTFDAVAFEATDTNLYYYKVQKNNYSLYKNILLPTPFLYIVSPPPNCG